MASGERPGESMAVAVTAADGMIASVAAASPALPAVLTLAAPADVEPADRWFAGAVEMTLRGVGRSRRP